VVCCAAACASLAALLHLALLLVPLTVVVLWVHHADELQFLGCCPCLLLWPLVATMGE
jgi:hypothetical protein